MWARRLGTALDAVPHRTYLFLVPLGRRTPVSGAADRSGRRPDGVYSTGDLARLTDNTLRTVRHYEELGLVVPLARQGGQHRLFDQVQLERLRFITDLRSLSFPLASVREVLACRDGAQAPCDAAQKARQTLDAHILELQDKMRILKRVRDTLVRTRATLQDCAECEESWETRYCDHCDVRTSPDSPSLVNLLW